MRRFHAIVVPLLVLSLMGSGTALAWDSPCCPEAMERGMSMPQAGEASQPPEPEPGPRTRPANAGAMAGSTTMADCGDSDATGMCCLGGVMGPPSFELALAAPPAVWPLSLISRQRDQPPAGLFRPPQA